MTDINGFDLIAPKAGRKREVIEAVPNEYYDESSLVGPPQRIRERYKGWGGLGRDWLDPFVQAGGGLGADGRTFGKPGPGRLGFATNGTRTPEPRSAEQAPGGTDPINQGGQRRYGCQDGLQRDRL